MVRIYGNLSLPVFIKIKQTLCSELPQQWWINGFTPSHPSIQFPASYCLNLKKKNVTKGNERGFLLYVDVWVCVLASHWRAFPLLPLQTQCGPSALATCPQETLPRESCHSHRGEGRTVDMYLAAFWTHCIWIMHVIIFYGIGFHYKYYLTVENSLYSLNVIKLLKH